ncbi:MAG: hypothetical protein AAGC55_08955 [Myxococcota bacterium]
MATAAVVSVGCVDASNSASVRTGTQITPEFFAFAEISPERVGGGWRAVCIHASTGQRLPIPRARTSTLA